MDTLFIEKTDATPQIIFNPEEGIYKIAGRSLPEDVIEFYDPVLVWLERVDPATLGNKEFQFRLEYFNTASSKMILDILLKLNDLYQEGIQIQVKWFYFDMDEDLMEAGEEFAELLELPIELVVY